MRIFSLFLCVVFLSSSSCEENAVSDSPDSEMAVDAGTLAIVTTEFADQGCEVLLLIEENGEEILLMPVELDERFKKHDLKLSIEFHSSRIAQTECQLGRPVIIDRATLVE